MKRFLFTFAVSFGDFEAAYSLHSIFASVLFGGWEDVRQGDRKGYRY